MELSNSYLLYNLALLCINELIVFACAGYGQVLWNSAGFKWQSYIEVCALQEWIVLLWWRPEDNVCLYVILLGNITPRPNKTTSAIKQTWPEGTTILWSLNQPAILFWIQFVLVRVTLGWLTAFSHRGREGRKTPCLWIGREGGRKGCFSTQDRCASIQCD